MYKALCAAVLAVTVAYLYPVLSELYCHSNSTLGFTNHMALSSVSRNVVRKVLAIETPEGAGPLVRRSIGSMNLRNLTPFLMLDHFHVEQGVYFNILLDVNLKVI